MTDLLSQARLRSKYFTNVAVLAGTEADYNVAANSHLFKSENNQSTNFDSVYGFGDGTRYNIRIESDGDDVFVKFNSTDNDPIFIAGSTVYEEFNIPARNIFLTSASATTAQIDSVTTVADTGVKNVDTFTLVDQATTVVGDYIVTYDTSGNAWAVYASKTALVANVDYFTFTTKAGTTNADWFSFSNAAGTTFGVALQKTVGGAEPTAQTWFNIPQANRYQIDISAATTAAQVATAVYDALVVIAPTGLTLANGTSTRVDITNSTAGDVVLGTVNNGLGTTTGSIAFTNNTLGVGEDPEPTGAIWTAIPAARKSYVDLSGASTLTNVTDAFRTALNALTGWSTKFTSSGTTTLISTNDQIGPVSNALVKSKIDGSSAFSVAQTTLGVASNLNSTYFKLYTKDAFGADTVYGVWYNVNGEGTQPTDSTVDSWQEVAITLGTQTATNVADATEAVLDALSAVFTSNNAGAVLSVTHVVKGPRHIPVDGGTGFTLAIGTPGAGDAANVKILVR